MLKNQELKVCMKEIAKYLSIFLVLATPSLANAIDWQLDKDCLPKTFSSKSYAFVNKVKFWNSQLIALTELEAQFDRYVRTTPASLEIRYENVEGKIAEKYVSNLRDGFPDAYAREIAVNWGKVEVETIKTEFQIYRKALVEQPKYFSLCRSVITAKLKEK